MRMQKKNKLKDDDSNIKYLICAMYHRTQQKVFKCSAHKWRRNDENVKKNNRINEEVSSACLIKN